VSFYLIHMKLQSHPIETCLSVVFFSRSLCRYVEPSIEARRGPAPRIDRHVLDTEVERASCPASFASTSRSRGEISPGAAARTALLSCSIDDDRGRALAPPRRNLCWGTGLHVGALPKHGIRTTASSEAIFFVLYGEVYLILKVFSCSHRCRRMPLL
jgi:hypothetical protein